MRTSEERHGRQARIRYRALLTAAMRRAAADPEGLATADRVELLPGIRSFHVRHSRDESREAPVANPVYVIFYRMVEPGLVEILRVLLNAWRRAGMLAQRPDLPIDRGSTPV